jgi:hypothetical protein
MPSTVVTRTALALAGRATDASRALLPAPLTDDDFAALLEIGGQHRLIGEMVAAVEDEVLPVTDAQRARLCEQHRQWMTQSLRVERVLLRVCARLVAAAVDVRVLKGAALARLVYADPAHRVFGDADLLVRAGDLETVRRVVCDELGGERPFPELRPGFDREFGKELLLRLDRVELDVHRTFVTGPFGLTIDLEHLFDHPTPFEVGGTELRTLGPNGLFLHACYNAALGDYPVRWGSLRDLLLVCERLDVDDQAVIAIARDWRATAVVRQAARTAIEVLDLGPMHVLSPLAELDVPRREERLLQSYLTTARSYRRALAALAVIPGVRARFRYARAIAVPSAAYLESRGWTKRRHVRRGLQRLRVQR